MSKIHYYSEIGDLEGVIIHPPGPEVENMTPKNAERALYSDILNLSVARREYNQLECTLEQLTKSYRVADLLKDILKSTDIKEKLIKKICYNEGHPELIDHLTELNETQMAKQLIQGVPLRNNNLTDFLSKENFALHPLHNFFFTRDASMALCDSVLIGKMANRVRERETVIMEAIFKFHPLFRTGTINPAEDAQRSDTISIEGGDLLVLSEDILLVGIGARTTSQGVDFLIDRLKTRKKTHHIIVQELPQSPESFIHLDMVFTQVDNDACVVYEPLIIKPNRYQTVKIDIDNGNVTGINSVDNILTALRSLGMDLKPSFCGGDKDPVMQEREQWHSGANFFAIGPGKIIGYNRNVHTLESLNQNGFEIIRAKDFLDGNIDLRDYQKYVLTIDGAELSRGGGGVRCMTMPFSRKSLA